MTAKQFALGMLMGLTALSLGATAWAGDDDHEGHHDGGHEHGEEECHHAFADPEEVWWGHKGVAFAPYMPFEKTAPPKRVDVRPFDIIYFDFDKADLRQASIETCDDVLAYMMAHPESKIRVEGHCCDWGTDQYNKKLGKRRAQAVKKYLTSHGIEGNRIKAVSRGENRPAHENASPERPLNRRAEVVIRLAE